MLEGPHFNSGTDGMPSLTSEEFSLSEFGVATLSVPSTVDPLLAPHETEHAVWCELQDCGAHFEGLVVRTVPDGICLQGTMEDSDEEQLNSIIRLVKRVARVDHVLNQLVVRETNVARRLPR